MRILISRRRNKVILTRDAQKGTGRLLESVKCHYYNLTFLLLVQLRLPSDGSLSQCLDFSSMKTMAKTFPFEHPRLVTEQNMASGFLSSVCKLCNPTLSVSSWSVASCFTFKTIRGQKYAATVVSPSTFLPWLDAELHMGWKTSQEFMLEADITWQNDMDMVRPTWHKWWIPEIGKHLI